MLGSILLLALAATLPNTSSDVRLAVLYFGELRTFCHGCVRVEALKAFPPNTVTFMEVATEPHSPPYKKADKAAHRTCAGAQLRQMLADVRPAVFRIYNSTLTAGPQKDLRRARKMPSYIRRNWARVAALARDVARFEEAHHMRFSHVFFGRPDLVARPLYSTDSVCHANSACQVFDGWLHLRGDKAAVMPRRAFDVAIAAVKNGSFIRHCDALTTGGARHEDCFAQHMYSLGWPEAEPIDARLVREDPAGNYSDVDSCANMAGASTLPNASRRSPGPAGSLGGAMRDASWGLWWLHVPKCASSFNMSVAGYPRSPERTRKQHQRLHADVASLAGREGRGASSGPASALQLVGFFRQPEARLLSAYLHMRRRVANVTGKTIVKCCNSDWGWPRKTYKAVHQRIVGDALRGAGLNPAILAPFLGCQTNSVLGRGCMSGKPVSSADLARAMELVSRFRFVGDVARWNESICLFNYIMTGRRFLLRHQLTNTRATPLKLYNQYRSQAATHSVPADPVDRALYGFVSLRLSWELEAYGITQGSCPTFDSALELPGGVTASERVAVESPLAWPPPGIDFSALAGGA